MFRKRIPEPRATAPHHRASFHALLLGSSLLFSMTMIPQISATRLLEVSALDREYLRLHLEEGKVEFADDASGPTAFSGHDHEPHLNWVVRHGEPLAVEAAEQTASWRIVSEDDPRYGSEGLIPRTIHRKTKLNGMAEFEWDHDANDFRYDYTLEHFLYLRLPHPLQSGKRYEVRIDPAVQAGAKKAELLFDEAQMRSEAIRVNLVGHRPDAPIMAADLYYWMGDGGPRDYSAYEGNKVYLLNVTSGERHEVGKVSMGQRRGEDVGGRQLTPLPVWRADFTGAHPPGTYRLVIDGIGSSADFEIANNVHRDPFRVSTFGFFYMRIGQDSMDMVPVPRRPLWYPVGHPEHPEGYPKGFRVVKTSMHPWHPDWNTFTRPAPFPQNDPWDGKHHHWKPYILEDWPENPNAWGAHSDALDWDRHLGHVSTIYDTLLPFILTGGHPVDDDTGIAESGNGIPDIIDTARYEVDFWLRLKDEDGYAHGVSNIDRGANIAHQAAATGMAAWANATNAAMLAEAFRIAGKADLAAHYTTAAREAYDFARALPLDDQMLTLRQDVGEGTFRGSDFKATAAAFLFNLTGEAEFEREVVKAIRAHRPRAPLVNTTAHNLLYAAVGYLFSPHEVNDPDLREALRARIIAEARAREARYMESRPSRRATDNDTGYFQTIQHIHRTIVAHALSEDPDEKTYFLKALLLEADWGLGRNPLNIIQMTTATTALAEKRSIENAYTSGRNDGTPGLHPGHTPYLNVDDWAPDMVMGRPSWMREKGHPSKDADWPHGEMYFNTRYVWSHSEFTPQQTMRGKQALYGYLHGIASLSTTPAPSSTEK